MARFSDRRFAILGFALLSAALTVAGSFVDRATSLPAGVRLLVAGAPLVPLVAMFFGIARWIEALDELQRLVHLEAFVFQFGATGLLVMGYGMLARAAIVPDLPASRLYPFLWLSVFGFWAIGLSLVRRRYR